MIERLANILYWAACALSLAWLALCLSSLEGNSHANFVLLMGVLGAIGFWLAGRAARYILTGR